MPPPSHTHNNHTNEAAVIVRPSEAQLRWAQFHHHRRAVGIRALVEALHQRPSGCEDVAGAFPDDDRSSSSSSSAASGTTNSETLESIRQIRQGRPAISKGRRALLRVSKRAYRQRQQWIDKEGYQGILLLRASTDGVDSLESSSSSSSSNSSDDDADQERGHQETTGTAGTTKALHHHQNSNSHSHSNTAEEKHDNHEEALNEIFMVKSSRRRQRHRRRHRRGYPPQSFAASTAGSTHGSRHSHANSTTSTTNAEEERFKRFQAACHAMMMNLAAPPKQSLIVPTRIWTRTVDAAAALDDAYLDPKWGIRKRPARTATDANTTGGRGGTLLLDRGASWMTHLPKAMGRAGRDNPYDFYHPDPSRLPPSATVLSTVSSHHSAASILALQAPGAQKFHQLVSLVQQRMIQKQQAHVERTMRRNRQSSGGTAAAPRMKLRSEVSHSQEDDDDDDYSNQKTRRQPGGARATIRRSLTHGPSVRERRAHYVPRMHLKDFLPEGHDDDDEGQQQQQKGDLSSRPPRTMRLREFPGAQHPPERRTSRAHELAQSFEPAEERRLSKTRQMALSLENDPKYPTMKLKPSLEFVDDHDSHDDEKKVPDVPPRRHSHALAEPYESTTHKEGTDPSSSMELQRPSRHSHSLSELFVPVQGDDAAQTKDEEHLQQYGQKLSPPRRSQMLTGGQDIHQGDLDQQQQRQQGSRLLSDPPRRQPHPLSDRFVQAMQASQQPPTKPQIVVQPLPPGACCVRCTQTSPRYDQRSTTIPGKSGDLLSNNDTTEMECSGTKSSLRESGGDFFDKVRHLNATTSAVAKGSIRMSDFFSELRQSHSMSEREGKDNDGRQSTGNGGEGTQRVSDFFGKVRNLNNNNRSSTTSDDDQIAQQGTSGGPSHQQEEAVEESDFFAQVREMIATDDDDEETAAQRVSDFFAQVRQMNTEDEAEVTKDQDQCLLCEDCQIHDIEDRLESASVTLSPAHHRMSTPQSPEETTTSTPIRQSGIGTPVTAVYATPVRSIAINADEDTKSEHSAISDLWNRGRSSLNVFANKLNAISEKNGGPHAPLSEPQNKSARLSTASSIPGRVGGFLQILRVDVEQSRLQPSEGRADKAVGHNTEGQEVVTPNRAELDYASDNDLEAMAAYRKSQESKNLSMTPDDASSNSSFRALPDDIRQVVKQMGTPPLKQRDGSQHVPRIEESEDDPIAVVPTPQSTAARFSYLGGSSSKGADATADRGASPEVDLGTDPVASALARPSTRSPSRYSVTSSALENMSPEKYREAHGKVILRSPLLGSSVQEIIDTDDTTSDASNIGMDPHILANMMLSPDLLQKRLHQAIRSVEERQWDQVKYLLNANPWLAEMCELTTNQYLLHKLAFFGSAAPRELCEHLMDMFPSAVHKFDQDGNVPLHLAAAAGHLKMIRMLGDRFESGASIRNEDGMLPLHFTIASYGDYEGSYDEEGDDEESPNPLRVIKTVLKYFAKAVAITDNDGNLPLHVAAECLNGGLGVDVIYLLLDEADRQLQDPSGARFCNRTKLEEIVNDDISASTVATDRETDSSAMDEDTQCNMVKNEFGETPLMAAVRAYRGWETIEALVSGPGGRNAALFEDADKNNALHLLVSGYQDPTAAMSILKIAPKTATLRNSEGMLPIEAACFQLMPEEVILAIALVDLPFDIDDKDSIKVREDAGGSWWFLACECDDHYVDIVQEIVMVCTHQQVQELCFMKGGSSNNNDTAISRATPKCREVLSHALRFLGRFELVGGGSIFSDASVGLKVFDAMDFEGTMGGDEARRVVLQCYSIRESFAEAASILREVQLDSVFVEEVITFGDFSQDQEQQPQDIQEQHCISIECPQLTLNRVVDGMTNKGRYENDRELRKKYAAKMCAVLRLIAKALRHLHSSGVVHGDVSMQNCGKFEHSWKLLGRMDVQRIGEPFRPTRFRQSFPPEALQLEEQEGAVFDSDNAAVSFASLTANPSIDIWGFGKLAYETLVGKPLVEFDPNKKTFEDIVSLLEILEWDQSSIKNIFTELLDAGVTESCAELIATCLFAGPDERPQSMEAILVDPFWKDMRQYRERSSPNKRRGDAASSVYTESSPKSIFTETASAVDTSQEVETAEI